MGVDYDDFIAGKAFEDVRSGFEPGAINPKLFDFQKAIVTWALRRGRAAIFANTGMGKTAMQMEWADCVVEHTGKPVLVVAPLAVAKQSVGEVAKFDISAQYVREQPSGVFAEILVTNYEMLDKFDLSKFAGIVLDESSIIKNRDGKTRKAIIESCQRIPYRLSCTATPSPNDYMELGNQAEFLGVMGMNEMLAMFFTHDGGDTSKWRLKGHGEKKFWEWMATWAVTITKPSDLGFSDEGYDLPPLRMHEHLVESPRSEGSLFTDIARTLTERRQAKKATLDLRVQKVADLCSSNNDQWLAWCHTNDESAAIKRLIPDAVEVKGSDSIDHKESAMQGFSDGSVRVLVTKPSICGFGMNWQNCHNEAFVGLDDSYEQMYQAIRRCWRFGQENPVDVHIVTAEALGAIKSNIERKEKQMEEMQLRMVEHMQDAMKKEIQGTELTRDDYDRKVHEGRDFTIHNADCVHLAREIPDNSVGYTVFSPPFASLYVYSNSEYDMGNAKNDSQFYEQFKFLVKEMYRITMPGRLLSFHCMNLPTSKQNDGYIGIRDFRGDLIKMFQDEGWIYHSEVCIWKDPVTAMQRTKALGLLHKTIRKDSAMSRQGIPDYLVTMRKPGENPEPISHTHEDFPVQLWQKYASPVWMDINPSRTLNYRDGRDEDDERHICPLQLDVIERALNLWSKPGDLVFSPFTGIGSEGYCAVKMGRKFIGSELKESYYDLAIKNIEAAHNQTINMFSEEPL